jgi:hypothetical protein
MDENCLLGTRARTEKLCYVQNAYGHYIDR